jgi:hypothetical protein
VGCSSQPYKVAPVSGKVTLDGKPLKAWVHFAPMGSKENPNPGPTSHGQSDAQGNYELSIDPEHRGSVVGKSRVYIRSANPAESEGAQQRDAGGPRLPKDKVPRKYNEETTLTFTVPEGGTDQANFELSSR